MNLKELLTRQNDDVFLIDFQTGRTITYKECFLTACYLSHWLEDQGFVHGDRISILLDNSVLFAEFYFACIYAGITVVPISPSWSKDHIEYVIKNSDSKAIFVNDKYYQLLLTSLKKVNIDCILVGAKENHTEEKIKVFPDLERTILPKASEPKEINPEHNALIVYTSGTTAEPKGVRLSVGSLVENASLFIEIMGINKSHRFFNYLPMSYTGGTFNLLLIPYLAQASTVIAPTFSPQMMIKFWDHISLYQVNVLWLVPSIISFLLATDRGVKGKEYCKNIKLAFVGTAPLREQQKNEFEVRYSLELYENYGLTETLFISTKSPYEQTMDNSVGKLLPGIKVKIISEKGEPLPLGSEGEIAVKTPHLMKGYHGINTKNYLDGEGYFLTGDLGVLTSKNEIILNGRIKDLIIRGGVNISPAAIEMVLYKHPKVVLCAVVGIPDHFAGEEIVAIVKTNQDVSLLLIEEDLRELCKMHLAHEQQPKFYLTLSEFPSSATGKIQKRKLRDWAKNCLIKNIETATEE